jgi:hypothetical protein
VDSSFSERNDTNRAESTTSFVVDVDARATLVKLSSSYQRKTTLFAGSVATEYVVL